MITNLIPSFRYSEVIAQEIDIFDVLKHEKCVRQDLSTYSRLGSVSEMWGDIERYAFPASELSAPSAGCAGQGGVWRKEESQHIMPKLGLVVFAYSCTCTSLQIIRSLVHAV